jgi:hypothetical protein
LVEANLVDATLTDCHVFGSQVEQAYNRIQMLDRRRPVMSAWANFFSGADEATVLPFRRAE